MPKLGLGSSLDSLNKEASTPNVVSAGRNIWAPFDDSGDIGTPKAGMALEFDGVSDEITLDTPVCGGNTEITLATWFQKDVGSTGAIAGWTTGGTYIRFTTATNLLIYFDGVDANFSYNTTFSDDGNWHHLVITYNGATGSKFYLDGSLTSPTVAGANDVVTGSLDSDSGRIGRIGNYGSVGSTLFSGKMANFQIWDKAWSADDVGYTYNNPEKLAFNNSRTSLTYSDLRLWYPMQDGHRGTQSYLLDGANTGLGPELITDPRFDTDVAAATTGTHWTTEAGWVIDNGVVTKTAGAANYVYTSGSIASAGTVYKVTFTLTRTAGSFRLYCGDANISGDITTSGTYTYYGTQTGSTNDIKFYGNSTFAGTLDNVSVKAVNDKNNGTSVFYGDELLTNDDANWDNTGAFAGTPGNWNYYDASENSGAGTLKQDDLDLKGGRTYSFTFVLAAGNNMGIEIKSYDGSETFVAEATYAPETSHTVTFTPSGDESGVMLNVDGDVAGDCGLTTTSFSLKEVGFASGWTDADAQVTVPQLAFQSYNELAWFTGLDEYVSIADQSYYSFGDGSNDSPFSVSAWIFMNEATKFRIIGKCAFDGSSKMEWAFITDADDDLRLVLYDGTTSNYISQKSNNTLSAGQWYQVAATYDATEANSGITLYVNGAEIASTGTNSGSYTALHSTDATVEIGRLRYSGSTTDYSEGCVTEVSIWNKELSLAEVQELYNDGEALDATLHSASPSTGTDNLVGYWRNMGTRTWTGLSTNSNNGTPTSVTESLILPAGYNGRDTQGFIMNRPRTSGFNSSGSVYMNSWIDLGSTTTVYQNNAFSIMAWVKPDDFATENWIMGQTSNQYISIADSTTIRIKCSTVTADFTTSALTAGQWVHIALVRDSSNEVTLYVNAVLNGGATEDKEDVAKNFKYRYLGSRNNDNYAFRGVVDDIAIYSATELSAAQIERNYKAGKRRHQN